MLKGWLGQLAATMGRRRPKVVKEASVVTGTVARVLLRRLSAVTSGRGTAAAALDKGAVCAVARRRRTSSQRTLSATGLGASPTVTTEARGGTAQAAVRLSLDTTDHTVVTRRGPPVTPLRVVLMVTLALVVMEILLCLVWVIPR